jgi:hypothetical protein
MMNFGKLRKITCFLFRAFIIGFFALVCLDIYIQLEAALISKPAWPPPFLTGLSIAIIYLLIKYAIKYISETLALYLPLLLAIISWLVRELAKLAYNLWIRRRKPDYVDITKAYS